MKTVQAFSFTVALIGDDFAATNTATVVEIRDRLVEVNLPWFTPRNLRVKMDTLIAELEDG